MNGKLMRANELLFKSGTNNTLVQLFRYTLVGGIAFLFDFGSLYFLTDWMYVHYLVSAALAFLAGITVNYLLSIAWVFQVRTMKNVWVEVSIFAVIGIVGLGMNELIIWFFTELAKFHYLISKLFSTVSVYLWNFFARKFLLFR